MRRAVLAPESCLKSLERYASVQESISFGLALGAFNSAQEIIVHFAPTPEETTPDAAEELSPPQIRSIAEISEASVADHAKHVTRMLPGGLYVQGIFIASSSDVFEDTSSLNKLRNILVYLSKSFESNSFLHGNPSHSERIIIHISSKTNTVTCKSIDLNNRAAPLKSVDLKFVNKLSAWQRIECLFEFDEIYPVIVKKTCVSVREQFQNILSSASKMVASSMIFLDGESNDLNEPLELICRKKKLSKSKEGFPKTMHASMFAYLTEAYPEIVEYIECDGSIHFSGIVASTVFLNPKSTIAEAFVAIKEDIVRSLAARFTMHCDALIDDNLLPGEKVCFNEPPRRVYINLKDGEGLQLCDYLFPGEAPAEALLSVKELLDIEIVEADVLYNVETPADTTEFDILDRDACSEESLVTPQETNRFMYLTGLSVALMILFLSIIIHYREVLFKKFT